jgi:hypothetical protein
VQHDQCANTPSAFLVENSGAAAETRRAGRALALVPSAGGILPTPCGKDATVYLVRSGGAGKSSAQSSRAATHNPRPALA